MTLLIPMTKRGVSLDLRVIAESQKSSVGLYHSVTLGYSGFVHSHAITLIR